MNNSNAQNDDNKEMLGILKLELELAKNKYDSELRREDSIINQAGRMQSVFSFYIAAVSIIATILSSHADFVPYKLSIGIIGSIVFLLMISLFFATLSQSRKKQIIWADVEDQVNHIEEHCDELKDEDVRIQYLIDHYKDHQRSLTDNNRFRVKLVECSMWALYASLAISIIWFVVVLIVIGR